MSVSVESGVDAGELSGVRVVEVGTFIAGPFASTILADFGADVVKIELPGTDDGMRSLGVAPNDDADSYWWATLGRNKRCVEIDIRSDGGRPLFERLIANADVLVENFRPGTLASWGFRDERLRELQPGLIILHTSGYGQDGPWRGNPGFDRNAQAFSGIVSVTGSPEGDPQLVGVPICDYLAGVWGALGILVSLAGSRRRSEGTGNTIDLALYETILPLLGDLPLRYGAEGHVARRTGNRSQYVAPGGAFCASDGRWLFISATGDRVFRRLMTAIGHGDVAEAAEYTQAANRLRHRDYLDGLVAEWVSARPGDAVFEYLQSECVPVTHINDIADLMTHPQVVARENFVSRPDSQSGSLRVAAPVPRLEQRPGTVRWLGQRRGESTETVLREDLGLSDEEIAALREAGAVG
jgi:formyl-CoA transferase